MNGHVEQPQGMVADTYRVSSIVQARLAGLEEYADPLKADIAGDAESQGGVRPTHTFPASARG